MACDSELLLVKPGICKFVPTQSQCIEWEEFACFCLQKSPPEPEPESEEETTDPVDETTDPTGETTDPAGETNKGEELDSDSEDDYDKDMDKDMEWMMYTDPMMGMMTYTSVAIMSAVGTGLDLFRYNPSSSKYSEWSNLGATATTNFWQYGSDLARYSGLTFWTVASITQILASFKISPEINMMVWMYGGMAGSMLGLVSHGLLMYAYDIANTVAGTSSTPSETAAAENVLNDLELEFIGMAAHETLVGIELHSQGMNWMAANMMMMGMDKKEEMMEEMKDEDGVMPEGLFKATLNYMF